jgi:hypothetical protein
VERRRRWSTRTESRLRGFTPRSVAAVVASTRRHANARRARVVDQGAGGDGLSPHFDPVVDHQNSVPGPEQAIDSAGLPGPRLGAHAPLPAEGGRDQVRLGRAERVAGDRLAIELTLTVTAASIAVVSIGKDAWRRCIGALMRAAVVRRGALRLIAQERQVVNRRDLDLRAGGVRDSAATKR